MSRSGGEGLVKVTCHAGDGGFESVIVTICIQVLAFFGQMFLSLGLVSNYLNSSSSFCF